MGELYTASPRAYRHASTDFQHLLKVFVGLTVRSDDEWNDASPAEGIVGVLEWTRNAIIAVPHYIWSEDLINPLDLSNILRPDTSSTRLCTYNDKGRLTRQNFARFVTVTSMNMYRV